MTHSITIVITITTLYNGRYIFPGLALGAALGQTGVVTNAMINKSAEALVELLSDSDLKKRATFPQNVEIREIAAHLAARVFEQAVEENLKVCQNCNCNLVDCFILQIPSLF